MIVPLSRFFSTTSANGIHPNASQVASLKKWFWNSCFSRRYSSGVQRSLKNDLNSATLLKGGDASGFDSVTSQITPEFFTSNQFILSSVNTKTFVLLLANAVPRSFLSGIPVNLSQVMLQCNRTEFHHIFPKAFLKRIGIIEKPMQWMLANFCFLSQTDNRRINSRNPADYVNDIEKTDLDDILQSAFIPNDGLNKSYEDFIESRSVLLADYAKTLCS